MLCRDPYVKGKHAYPCGRCFPCLHKRKRVWTHRIMLESLLHKDNCFITLTYADEHLPKGGSLAPSEIQQWLKRFRFAIAPLRIRYYVIGEYGDATQRPHYHAAIFGYPKCRFGVSRYSRERKDCCDVCDTVRDTWGRGNVYVGSLETQSAQYVAGYVTKKMTRKDDARLKGRYPEFARMSLRPGIGADAMHDVASVFLQFNLEDLQGDVPSALRHGNRLMPLGRYLRRKLRLYAGMGEKAPEQELPPDVQAVYDAAVKATEHFPWARNTVYKNALIDAGSQRVENMKSRLGLSKSRRYM